METNVRERTGSTLLPDFPRVLRRHIRGPRGLEVLLQFLQHLKIVPLILLMHQGVDILINLDRLLVESRPIKFPVPVGGLLDLNVGHVQFQIRLHRFRQVAHQLPQNRAVRLLGKIQQSRRIRIRAVRSREIEIFQDLQCLFHEDRIERRASGNRQADR